MTPGNGEKEQACVGGGSGGFGLWMGAECGFVTPQHLAGHALSPTGMPALRAAQPAAWLSPCSVRHPHILHLCHRPVEHPHRGAFQVERKRLMKADFINQGCHWDDCCLPEPLCEQ